MTRVMRPMLLACAALLVTAAAAPPAHAQDRRVIQNRTMGKGHEFTLEPGVLPLDVLYKAFTLTGRYTWHINNHVAWEALSITYAPTTDVSLLGFGIGPVRFNHFTPQGNELQENFGYGPFDVDQMRVFVESNLVVTPLYGKFSLFNRRNARLELYGVGGVALANFVAYNPYPPDPIALGGIPAIPTDPLDFLPQEGQTFLVRPGLDIGGGTRLFVARWLSFRLDARAYGFLEGYNGFHIPKAREFPVLPFGVTQIFYLGVGTSINLGGGS